MLEEKVREKEITSPLLNKKITIALVKRRTSSLYKDINMSTLSLGGSKSFILPTDKKGNLVNPLTKNEQTYLENTLGIDLSIHKLENNFWRSKQARCKLRKVGNNTESANLILDLNDVYDFILYKIALVHPRVAKTWDKRYERKEYEFVIIDGDVELKEELKYNVKEDAVLDFLSENRNSKRKLFDLLRMYGVRFASKEVNYTNSTEWIYNELKKASRKPAEIKKLYGIVSLGAEEISSKIFLEDCITLGLITRTTYEYRISDGVKIGNNEMEAIRWLNNDLNQATKTQFGMLIDEYYEKHK